MGAWANDSGMDAGLDWYADCDLLIVCSAQPTTYTEATVTFALADIALTPGNGNGDFTIANGDSSGRKLTTVQQTGVPIDADGTANHLAYVKTGDTTLRRVTPCTSQALTSGGTLTIPAHDHEIADPVTV